MTSYPSIYTVIFKRKDGKLDVWSVSAIERDGYKRLLEFCRQHKEFVVVEGKSFQRYHYPDDSMFREGR